MSANTAGKTQQYFTSNSEVIKRVLHVMFWFSLEAVKCAIFAKDKVSLAPVFDMLT